MTVLKKKNPKGVKAIVVIQNVVVLLFILHFPGVFSQKST